MVFNIFTDGASRGNPGDAGAGVVMYDGKELYEEFSEYLGKKTNNEAEYTAVIRALERLDSMNETKGNIFADSEFLIKQVNGEYRVKSEKIKPLYEKVQKLLEGKEIKFHWVPREDNSKADSLANKGIDDRKMQPLSTSLKLDKAFFGKINCIKLQMNEDNDIYFHMGLLDKKTNNWNWEKVKMSDTELAEIVNLLKKPEGKCSFFHSFDKKTTQIWCNKSENSFSIKIKDVSKNLSVGEFELLRIILEECIRIKNFEK